MEDQEKLDRMQCQDPNCTHREHAGHFVLGARCCNSSAVEAHYDRDTGSLIIRCFQCERPVCQISVEP